MISIVKKDNTYMYEVANNFLSIDTKYDDENLSYLPTFPKISEQKSFSYNQWLDMFQNEIDEIAEEYIDFCHDISNKKGFKCQFNKQEFKEKLKKEIYKSSYNRFKYYQDLI